MTHKKTELTVNDEAQVEREHKPENIKVNCDTSN
jgi:hypothetical protein